MEDRSPNSLAATKVFGTEGAFAIMHSKVIPLFLLAVFLVFSGTLSADEAAKEHGHKTPHGGIVREADGIHLEFFIDKSGAPKLYLYDKAMKPLVGTGMEARLTVKGHDGAQVSRSLKPSKDPKEDTLYKTEPITGLNDWDTAVVSLKLKGRWHHFRFSHH
jgi:hypothetical protein